MSPEMLFRTENAHLNPSSNEPGKVSNGQMTSAKAINHNPYINPTQCCGTEGIGDGMTNGIIGIEVGFKTDAIGGNCNGFKQRWKVGSTIAQ